MTHAERAQRFWGELYVANLLAPFTPLQKMKLWTLRLRYRRLRGLR